MIFQYNYVLVKLFVFLQWEMVCTCVKGSYNVIAPRHDVYIAGFFPYSRHAEKSGTGRGVMPSVKLALDHVNDYDSVLRNYRLHMWWNDTMVI